MIRQFMYDIKSSIKNIFKPKVDYKILFDDEGNLHSDIIKELNGLLIKYRWINSQGNIIGVYDAILLAYKKYIVIKPYGYTDHIIFDHKFCFAMYNIPVIKKNPYDEKIYLKNFNYYINKKNNFNRDIFPFNKYAYSDDNITCPLQ